MSHQLYVPSTLSYGEEPQYPMYRRLGAHEIWSRQGMDGSLVPFQFSQDPITYVTGVSQLPPITQVLSSV
jgi:hypothetical protein